MKKQYIAIGIALLVLVAVFAVSGDARPYKGFGSKAVCKNVKVCFLNDGSGGVCINGVTYLPCKGPNCPSCKPCRNCQDFKPDKFTNAGNCQSCKTGNCAAV